MKKETVIKISIVVTPFIVVGLIFFGISFFRNASPKVFRNTAEQVSFRYHSDLGEEPLSEQEKKDRYIVKLLPQLKNKYSLEVELRYEKRLRGVAALAHSDPLDMIMANTEQAFPQKYSGYKKVSEKDVTVNGKKGSEMVFTYTGRDGEKIKDRFLAILRDPDTAFYLLAQAKEKDFDAVNKKYFERIFQSIEFGAE